MTHHTKADMEARRKPSMIINTRPPEQIYQAQRQLAAFVWDQDLSEEENRTNIHDMLDALGLKGCVQPCCRKSR